MSCETEMSDQKGGLVPHFLEALSWGIQPAEGLMSVAESENDSSPAFFYFHGGPGGLDIGISLWVCGVWSGPALMLCGGMERGLRRRMEGWGVVFDVNPFFFMMVWVGWKSVVLPPHLGWFFFNKRGRVGVLSSLLPDNRLSFSDIFSPLGHGCRPGRSGTEEEGDRRAVHPT